MRVTPPLMTGRPAVECGRLALHVLSANRQTGSGKTRKRLCTHVRTWTSAGKQGIAGNALLLSSEKQESETKFKPKPFNLNFTSPVSGDSGIILYYIIGHCGGYNTITDGDNWENPGVPAVAKVHTKVVMSYWRKESFLSSAGMCKENKPWQTLQRRYAVS